MSKEDEEKAREEKPTALKEDEPRERYAATMKGTPAEEPAEEPTGDAEEEKELTPEANAAAAEFNDISDLLSGTTAPNLGEWVRFYMRKVPPNYYCWKEGDAKIVIEWEDYE